MPVYDNPRQGATEAFDALRRLAHATRSPQDPAELYEVLGGVLGSVRSLRQVLDQLADAHITHRARAHDDAGNQASGASAALAAADELHQAGTYLDQVESRLNAASTQAGRIAWHPNAPETSTRWISVVFLDGGEADKVLDIISRDGTQTAIDHLAGYDYGEETTQVALANGYVYDAPPRGALDRVAAHGEHVLTYSPLLGHVNLLREYTVAPDPALAEPAQRTAAQNPVRAHATGTGPTSRRVDATDWFARNPSTTAQPRGLAL
ncbi:hypothetical protein J4H92_15060 [Leucobacter weissii]|uniref:Uncharacterized protein n=1 Tax=Leucobacter weissii TaxID=1983706 RepID=A0A939MRD1_9MICO|nr:hypothetical protein [Leucobacter weissii]MBO1903262.1 hypothetical protein [Leucobacter weissii]